MITEGTEKPHRVQIAIFLTFNCVQCSNFCKTAWIAVLSNRIAFRSVQPHACSVYFLNERS